MEQVRRYWQPDEGWVNLDERVLPTQPRKNGGGRGRARDETGPLRAAPGATVEVFASPPSDADLAAPDRAARVAALRRAIALSEVIGPPRALRGDGGFW